MRVRRTPRASITVQETSPVATFPPIETIPTGTPGSIPIEFEPLSYLRVIRPGDLFNGTFRFKNMHRNTFANWAARKEPGEDAVLVLDLPGQHMGEEAIAAHVANSSISPPLRARMAGRSRIAVRMPQGTSSVPLTLEKLLEALGTWPLNLDPLARYTGGGLRREMLEGVERSFTALSLLIWAELSQLGLFSLVHRTTSLGAPLVDAAYDYMRGSSSNSNATARAAWMRAAVEAACKTLADEAVESYSGSEPDWQIREVAEAQMEVYFALHFARRVLAAGDDFPLNRLTSMSGLFDLMMHPHPPSDQFTALEVPYRLITSPGLGTYFAHEDEARTTAYDKGERTELWTTRLRQVTGILRRDLPDDGVEFYAMWSPDYLYNPNPAAPGFTMSLTSEDRRHIVKRTIGHNEETTGGSYYDPVPAKVRELTLSPVGATLDVEGAWDPAPGYEDFGDLVGWQHRAYLGRDDKVVVVRAGWLYPSGFPVSQVQVTERRFQQVSGGAKAAVLRKRTFLVVNKSVLRFPEDGQADEGRGLPFKQLQAVTRVTPGIVTTDRVSGIADTYWVKLANGGRLNFEYAATDHAGRTSNFRMPQIFIPGTKVDDSGAIGKLATAWNASGNRFARAASMAGQVVRMVPGNRPEADLPLHRMELRAEAVAGNVASAIADGRRPFHPRIERVEAIVPGLDAIPGARQDFPRGVRFGQRYLDGELGGAQQAVVLTLEDPIGLDFDGDLGSDALGAIGQASQQISGIALDSGLVPLPPGGSLDNLIDAQLKWDAVLPDVKMLSRFALHLLLSRINVPAVSLPTFATQRSSHDLKRTWELQEPITRAAEIGPISLHPLPGDPRVHLKAEAAVTVDTFSAGAAAGGQVVAGTVPTGVRNPRVSAHGSIHDVGLSLFDLIEVRFVEIGFDAVSGQKPEARVKMNIVDPLVFDGPLEFLNGLKDLIPPNGFGDGPRIIPRPDGIEAGFDIALPNVEIGVFALKNMSLGASTEIPFDNRPVDFRFNFNERHRPFEIVVSGFGGGGFFAMVLDTGGIQEIEASLEFGAVASMNIGVASGSVSVKGGVYFRYRIGELIVEGYVELRGRMSVLGLITASLLFHMALAYEKHGQQKFVRGEATLRIEVEVLFFSTSVTLHVERRFSAGNNDPKLAETMSGSDWIDYCDAFA